MHKAVDSVEPDYTGKVDQGTKEGPAPPESYNSTTYPRTRDQNIKSNQIVDKIDVLKKVQIWVFGQTVSVTV